jgi:alpha-ribazole phosphatase
MDIYLIRHTKTNTIDGLCYGQSNVELADTFSSETRAIKGKLPDLTENCLIYSSPLSRCLDLAETFQQQLMIDERLLEVNFGDWEGSRFDDINQKTLQHWAANFVTYAPPNGESFNDLCLRVGAFWEELIATSPAEQVLVITHAGVIRALFAHVLQLPPANAFKFRVDVGSVHKLEHSNDYTYLHYTNL